MNRKEWLKSNEDTRIKRQDLILLCLKEYEDENNKPPSKELIDDFIKQHMEKGKQSPSRQEIADYVGVDRNTINNWINNMIKRGVLKSRGAETRKYLTFTQKGRKQVNKLVRL